MATTITVSLTVLLLPLLVILGVPRAFRLLGRLIGAQIKSKTQQRRELLLQRASEADKERLANDGTASKKSPSSSSLDEDWEEVNAGSRTPAPAEHGDGFDGIFGFFHPFCNAGGGGERVLFAAILATQRRYPKALCIIYTGDHDVSKEQILTNVRNRFNIHLSPSRLAILYLSTREYVLASKWPYFTLLGQSIGSMILGWEAFNLLTPDVFIDTMGYAFVSWLCKWLFPSVPTGSYVHYPTISTDMLRSLHDQVGTQGLNAGLGKGTRGKAKQIYWELFALLYSRVGGSIDVVMTNSSWTQSHISSLWGPARINRHKTHPISVVYPPCAVKELQEHIPLSNSDSTQRHPDILYIAQFRPEKQHEIIIDAFASFLKSHPSMEPQPRLILVGSVRDDQDEKRVYKLRLQVQDVKDSVEFHVNAKWPKILELLKSSSVGVNGMWNEHFGIGVVEYQAAGLISVVNDSGGPREDIVVPIDGQPTGFRASTQEEYANAFAEALSLSQEDTKAMRSRARESSLRFSEEVFSTDWIKQMGHLVDLHVKASK